MRSFISIQIHFLLDLIRECNYLKFIIKLNWIKKKIVKPIHWFDLTNHLKPNNSWPTSFIYGRLALMAWVSGRKNTGVYPIISLKSAVHNETGNLEQLNYHGN